MHHSSDDTVWKGDRPCQWETWIFTTANENPWTDRHETWHEWLRRGSLSLRWWGYICMSLSTSCPCLFITHATFYLLALLYRWHRLTDFHVHYHHHHFQFIKQQRAKGHLQVASHKSSPSSYMDTDESKDVFLLHLHSLICANKLFYILPFFSQKYGKFALRE